MRNIMKIDRMRMSVVCFIVCSLLITASVFAENGSIRVECTDADGKPLEKVKISIISIDGTVDENKKTDSKGVAVFNSVADGVYRVIGRKGGYVPSFYEFVKVGASNESVSLAFDLGMEKKLYFEDPTRAQRSAEMVAEGINASKESRFDEAEKALIRATELDPSNSEARYFLGVFYVQKRNFDKATEELEKASKLAGMFAALPPVEGKTDPARQKAIHDDAQRLIKNMMLIKGQLALESRDFGKAIDAFTQATVKDPNNPAGYYQLALALTHAGRLDEATEAIDKAIQLDPQDKTNKELKVQIDARIQNAAIKKAQSVLDEGNELLETGKADEALVKFREAIELIPEDRQSYIWKQIGRAHVELGQKEAAEEAYRKAAEFAVEEEAADYWKNLAQFYLESKNYKQALDILTDSRVRGTDSVDNVLMDLFEKSKFQDPMLAEAALERALEGDPENDEYYFLLGQMYYADGKEKDASTKELLNKYVEIGKDPDKVSAAKDMLVIVDRRSK